MESEDVSKPKSVQFVTDADGHKIAVILPIEEYEEMMADLHLGRVARESKGLARIPWEQIKAELGLAIGA